MTENPFSRGETVSSTLKYMYKADFLTFLSFVTALTTAIAAALAEMPAAAFLAWALVFACYLCGKRQLANAKLRLAYGQQQDKLNLFYRDLKLREQELKKHESRNQ